MTIRRQRCPLRKHTLVSTEQSSCQSLGRYTLSSPLRHGHRSHQKYASCFIRGTKTTKTTVVFAGDRLNLGSIRGCSETNLPNARKQRLCLLVIAVGSTRCRHRAHLIIVTGALTAGPTSAGTSSATPSTLNGDQLYGRPTLTRVRAAAVPASSPLLLAAGRICLSYPACSCRPDWPPCSSAEIGTTKLVNAISILFSGSVTVVPRKNGTAVRLEQS
jgi:hypothetical protein